MPIGTGAQVLRTEPDAGTEPVGLRTSAESISRNVGFTMAARGGYLASRIFIPPFVLSRIGLPAYSLWSGVFLLLSYIGMTTCGFWMVSVKYVAEYVAHDAIPEANEILSTGFVTMALMSAALFLLVLVTLPYLILWLQVPAPLQHEAKLLTLIVAAAFLSDLSFSVFSQALSGIQKIAEVQIIWLLGCLAEVPLIFWLIGSGHGVLGLGEAYAVRTALTILLTGVAAYRLVPWLRLSLWSLSRRAFRSVMRFGGIVQLNMMLGVGLNTIERAFAAPLIGLNAVGLLDISDKLPGMAGGISEAFAASFMPAASNIYSELADSPQQGEAIANLYLKGSRYMNFVAATLGGLFATVSGPLLFVWIGKVYPGTAFLMAIFAIQQNVHLLTGPGTSILRGIGRPEEEFFYSIPNLLLVLATVPLSRLILGSWSVTGLGSAVVVATIVSAVAFVIHANRLLRVSWRSYWTSVVAPGLFPYVVGILFALPAWSLVGHATRWHGAAIMLVISALYSITVWCITDRMLLDRQERLFFRDAIQREWRLLSQFLVRAEAA
jgi:O-antigen/teichoic acid export membrane protein